MNKKPGNKHVYLFILSTQYSGTTLLQKLIATSKSVSALKHEGQWLSEARPLLFTEDRWDPNRKIPWKDVRAIWEKHWDMSKPILLEKSPPHLFQAKAIAQEFPNSHFIVLYRNPYAYCGNHKKKNMHDPRHNQCTPKENAQMWIERMKKQKENIEQLPQCIHFSYEELAQHPEEICQQLSAFLPQLSDIQMDGKFAIKRRSSVIQNMNDQDIEWLLKKDIKNINSVLEEHKDVMEYFGYQYRHTSTATVSSRCKMVYAVCKYLYVATIEMRLMPLLRKCITAK